LVHLYLCHFPTRRSSDLSVLVQAYYEVDYLFTVKAGAFAPPPKVLSGVIRLTRKPIETLGCDEKLFWRVVKAAFNQRRKTLRNADRKSTRLNSSHVKISY